jgi:hypothetical protein
MPLGLAIIFGIFKIYIVNKLVWSGIMINIFDLMPDIGFQVKRIIALSLQFVFLVFLFALVFNLINKNKAKIKVWAIVIVVLIASNFGLKSVAMAKMQKQEDLCYSAKGVVENLVMKNPYLKNERCLKVKILSKIDKKKYKAIAKMESDTEYLIEIEDLNDYVQVQIIPTSGLND